MSGASHASQSLSQYIFSEKIKFVDFLTATLERSESVLPLFFILFYNQSELCFRILDPSD